MPLSHNVGFYGIAYLSGDKATTSGETTLTDPVAILATGGSMNLNTEPMFSTGVWGAGWYNAANQVAYAFNVVTLEGDVSYELLAGDTFDALRNFAFENRAEDYGTVVQVSPNGASEYKGPVWCSGANFDASEGAVVTGGFNYATDFTDKFIVNPPLTTGGSPDAKAGIGEAPDPADGLFPFWATGLSHLPDGVTNWSASYTSELNFLTLCKPSVTSQKIQPDFITVGGMDAEGSVTLFGLTDDIDPENLTKVNEDVVIEMYSQSQYDSVTRTTSGTPYKIKFKYIIYNSASTAITTGGDYVTADLGFTAVGDGDNPPLDIEAAT